MTVIGGRELFLLQIPPFGLRGCYSLWIGMIGSGGVKTFTKINRCSFLWPFVGLSFSFGFIYHKGEVMLYMLQSLDTLLDITAY